MRRRSFIQFAVAAAAQAALPDPTLGTIASTQTDGLWLRDLPDGNPRRLLPAANILAPRFSPSGHWISYSQNGAVFVIPTAGGQPVSLGKALPRVQWMPRTDELLLQDDAGLKWFTAANRWLRPDRQIAHATLPALVREDELVYADAVTRERGPGDQPMRMGRLNRVAPNSPGAPRLLFSKYRDCPIPCAWSGDGEQVVFWVDPDFSASLAADGLDLYRISGTGGTPQSLHVTTLVFHDMVSLAPEGSRMAVSAGSGRYSWQQKRIASIDLDSAEVTYLTDPSVAAITPVWSPAGDRIAYSAAPAPANRRDVGGGEPARRLLAKRRIWVAGENGSRQLIDDDQYRDEKPLWSADGTHLLFARLDSEANRTLWLTGVANPQPVQVAGPLSRAGDLPGESWFGNYGYITWGDMFDWRRAA